MNREQIKIDKSQFPESSGKENLVCLRCKKPYGLSFTKGDSHGYCPECKSIVMDHGIRKLNKWKDDLDLFVNKYGKDDLLGDVLPDHLR